MIGWLVALLAVLVVYGAAMWVKPTRRDREQADLRAKAMQKGLKIQHRYVSDTSISGRINKLSTAMIFYRLPVKRDDENPVTLLRSTGESGIYLPDGWIWEEDTRLNDAILNPIVDRISTWPEGFTGLDLAPDSIGIGWQERVPEELDLLISELHWLKSIIDQ